MRNYSVFELYVVKKDNYKFICEKIIDNEYTEIFTKEKLILDENEKVESLTKYYPTLALVTYKDNHVLSLLMLEEKDILLKYIEINQNVMDRSIGIDDILKRQQEDLKGWEILKKEFPEFTKQLARESLQGLGIIDEEENLIGPYRDILKKERTIVQLAKMYETYVDSKKDDMPDIPIKNAKELRKQKPLNQ